MFFSEQWTRDELLSYLRNRQNEFLKNTAVLMKRDTITYTPGVANQPLPEDWMITQRVVWNASGSYKELPRTDTWDADYGDPAWTTPTTTPFVYSDSEEPSLELRVIPPAAAATGQPEILYIYQDPILPSRFNSTMRIDEFAPYPRVAGMPIQDRYRWTSVGLSIPIPATLVILDMFNHAIKYGVMADMLTKIGRAQDVTRATYCEARYQEGIEAAAILLAGWQGG